MAKTKSIKKKRGRKRKPSATVAILDEETAIMEKRLRSLEFRPNLLAPQSKEATEATLQRFMDLKKAMQAPTLRDKAIDIMLSEIVAGAYIDRITAYSAQLTEKCQLNADNMQKLVRVRQTTDTHLLNIIRAIRDIKRPPVNVVVKEAEQVNVAEQINQGEQQVNIGKQQANIGRDQQLA